MQLWHNWTTFSAHKYILKILKKKNRVFLCSRFKQCTFLWTQHILPRYNFPPLKKSIWRENKLYILTLFTFGQLWNTFHPGILRSFLDNYVKIMYKLSFVPTPGLFLGNTEEDKALYWGSRNWDEHRNLNITHIFHLKRNGKVLEFGRVDLDIKSFNTSNCPSSKYVSSI